MNENCIVISQVEGEKYEVLIFEESGKQLLERPYFCIGWDSVVDTAKLLRKSEHPEFPIYKQMLGEEAVKILG